MVTSFLRPVYKTFSKTISTFIVLVVPLARLKGLIGWKEKSVF
ncbi:Hypothetical protein I595_1302 [Croceitalea dokdonensis DOKDO 023]|uniref:Uncharacterized protein n=1 Tax=Croceitalea dokdonensis DOKDO 023 TaxID=1300341 RepID=A0A0P7AXT2_9FLAO|nr:Hypothetical protein I595_1302 [Croceitalea dokdonensis DOKDO 023]